MGIHSHIQIPKTTLKNFQDESDPSKKVWYLDIPSNQIKRKSAKLLGTEKGYYSKDGEVFWNKTVEDSIGKLNQKIRNFGSGKSETVVFSSNDTESVKQYIKAATVRRKSVFSDMIATLAPLEDCTPQRLHDTLSVFGMNMIEEITDELGFDKMVATILINHTDRNFVVPCNCYYCIEIAGYPNYIMPISPKCAFLLLPREQLAKYGKNYGIIDNPEQILRLNRHALKYEYFVNRTFIAANSRLELEDLQNILSNPPW